MGVTVRSPTSISVLSCHIRVFIHQISFVMTNNTETTLSLAFEKVISEENWNLESIREMKFDLVQGLFEFIRLSAEINSSGVNFSTNDAAHSILKLYKFLDQVETIFIHKSGL